MSAHRINRKPGISQKGQATLELAIVFICLVVIAVASMGWFSNFNLSSLDRIELFRRTRLDAINNPERLMARSVTIRPGEVKTLNDPTAFLEYFPHATAGSHGDSLIPPTDYSGFVFEDPRVVNASLMLEKLDYINSFIFPYKIYQMYGMRTMAFNSGRYDWPNATIINTVRTIARDGANLTTIAMNSFNASRQNFTAAIDAPLRPGPFDDACTLENYGLPNTPEGLEQLVTIQEANDQRRETMRLNIDQMGSQLTGFDMLFFNTTNPDALKPSFEYIGSEFGHVWMTIKGYSTDNHRKAVAKIEALYNTTSQSFQSVPLTDQSLSRIDQVYNVLNRAVATITVTQATQAQSIGALLAGSTDIKAASGLYPLVTQMKTNLDSALDQWDIVDSRTGFLDTAKDRAVLLHYSAMGLPDPFGNINSGILSNTVATLVAQEYSLMMGMSSRNKTQMMQAQGLASQISMLLASDQGLAKEVAQDRLLSQLDWILEDWDARTTEAERKIADSTFRSAQLAIWALYEVTDVNRLLQTHWH